MGTKNQRFDPACTYKTGHPNCRQPDKLIVAGQPPMVKRFSTNTRNKTFLCVQMLQRYTHLRAENLAKMLG